MVMMEPNVPLLRKAVEWVEEQDQKTSNREWRQGSWFVRSDWLESVEEQGYCDTAYCIAGYVTLVEGWTPVFDTSGYATRVIKEGEWEQKISVLAEELLGLDSEQASLLFDGDNDAVRIRQIAESIAGERL